MSAAEPQHERTEDSVSRREFLRAGGLGVVGLSLSDRASWAQYLREGPRRNCILVVMTGGPSQLETFDPKPDAAADVRGTLGAIATSVPGVFLSETLPLLAQRAHRFSLIRSLRHSAAPIHETGLQLLQTGRLSCHGIRFPNVGKVVAQASPGGEGNSIAALLPQPIQNTGMSAYLGQEPTEPDRQFAEQAAELLSREPDSVRRLYGSSRFGELLLQSRLLVEQGVRCVTVNLFHELGSQLTWDAHGDPVCGPATIANCRDVLCPALDAALSGLLDDLTQRGLLEETLVIAAGEMGRTPRINERGGRDHWTTCWSAFVAGGGTVAGQVIGASDGIAGHPLDRPVELGELPSSMLHWLGIDGRKLTAVVGKRELPLLPNRPLYELWGAKPEECSSDNIIAAAV
jgi:uncharacterized protein (DUF1501 family)